MVMFTGSIVAQAGRLNGVLALSLEHVRRSRTEPGCLAHAALRDAENPARLGRAPCGWTDDSMNAEKIKVRNTESGQTMDVVVLSKRADHIEVVLGEGVHSVKCGLTPTRNALAYAGSVMGREIVYERSREQVQADIDRVNPALRKSRPR
jgi:hypothetical protein